MPAALGDPAELLVVLVDERARMTDLVAPDRDAGWAIEIRQTRCSGPAKDRRDRRDRVAEERTQTIGPPAALASGGEDPPDLGRRGPPR